MTTEPVAEEHHHRSARERQRRGPMWGCLRWMVLLIIGFLALIALTIGGGWWYLGTSSFAGLVRLRIQKTLESSLGRKIEIGTVQIERGRENRIIINGLKIANAPGGIHPYFATIGQVVVTGGIDSFWGRKIRVGRIDLADPHLYVEIYPSGSKLASNFPHWQSGPKSRWDIYHLDLGTMYLTNGVVEYLDRRRDLSAVATNFNSTINVTTKEDLYAGIATSPVLHLRIGDNVPFDVAMRSQFRFTPNVLDLQSLALENGPDLRIFLNGRIAPLSDGIYSLHLTLLVGLNRVKQIFGVKVPLDGNLELNATMRSRTGSDFSLAGGWISPKLRADAYELANVRGKMDITGGRAVMQIDRAQYGGGTIGANYVLAKYGEPYPMSIDLHYTGIAIEKLFSDWNIKDTGLRGGTTGHLTYHWSNGKILGGAGEGTATLSKNASVFSNAKYPIPVGGSADFTLDQGTVTFKRAALVTDASTIDFSGKLRIEDAWTDLLLKIHSSDLSELDRLAFNFAHSAGKKTYDLLGLGGAGDISGNVRGRLKDPQVVARIASTATKYNNVLLGDADIDLRYDGAKSELTFERATFREGNGKLALSGTITFPDSGPSPRFDLAIDAANYPVEQAMAAANLKLVIRGLGTGRLVVTGTPDDGKVTFAALTVHEPKGDLRLNGSVTWLPGKGNTSFDLDVGAKTFPVADIVAFLELGKVPITGDITGTLHLTGPKSHLGGAGAITVSNGSIYDEPVTTATANIVFTEGTLRATNVTVIAPAGTITGEGQVDFSTNKFSYTIKSSSIDLSKLKLLSSLAGLLGGNITLSSTGAGTLDQPEVVLEATLNKATLKGLNLPPDAPPPTLYIAIRNGHLIVRGSAANVFTVQGDGTIAADNTLDGLVRVQITDIAKALAMSPKTASLPAAGKLTADLKLGGKLSSLEALRIDATFPEFDLRVSEHSVAPASPLRIGLRDGRIVLDDFHLALGHNGTTPGTFGVSGFAELTGAKQLNVDLRGDLEAALLQLFVPDLRAEGHVNIAAGLRGTMANPTLTGNAELLKAQVRFPGFPQLIDEISGSLIFKGDRIEIDALSARVGNGHVTAGGSIVMAGLTPKSARVTLQGTEVAIRYFEGLTIEGNFTLQLTGDTDRMLLVGDVTVNRALYYKEIDIGAALLSAVLARRAVTPAVSASWQDRVGLRLHLTSESTLAIRNNIADMTGGGDIDVSGTLANPIVLGLITLNEGGRIRFQDIDYRVVRGSINFQNPFRIDPFFDISLEARVNGGISEMESGPIDVTVTLTGTVDRMTPSITSDPPASDITLFSLLGLGALTNRTTAGGQPTDAASAGRTLLFSSVSRLLNSSVLSFADSFAIDPGVLDKTGDPGTKVSFAKRLSNDIRILVVYNTRDSKNRITVEWQVNPDWVLQFTRDELTSEYDVEARFRRRYDGHWAWGTYGRNPLGVFAAYETGSPITPAPPPITIPTTVVARPTGAIVTSVAFRADSRVDTSTFNQYVSVKVGQPLSIRAVQNSVKSLFATGDFRDIRVDSEPSGNGVAVVFALFTNYRVAEISFDGLRGATRDRATRELTFHLGDILSLNAVDRGAVAFQDFLHRFGYLDATVDPETTFVREQSRAVVVFHITRGPRANVGDVAIDGEIAPFTKADLIKKMKRGPGKSFELGEARLDADRMRQFLLHQEYRKAEVRYDKYTYDKAAKRVTLHYEATTGPVVRLAVTGVPASSLHGLLPFRRNQPYSEDVIDRAANDIVASLQERGYYNATVDAESATKDNVWTTTFHVNTGEQFRLSAVTFTGNQKMPDKKLAGVIQTSTGGGIRSLFASLLRRPSGVTHAQISSDRETLESYYRLQGFSQALVGTPVVTTEAASHTMKVEFPITEGLQTIVADVKIEGNEQVPPKDLPKLSLKKGDPLNPQVERADVTALQAYYADRGNAEVQIKAREEPSEDRTSTRVTYVIAEGPKVNIGDVVVRGNTYTKSSVIARAAQIEKHDPFSYTSILQAQQNLYRLGIFQRVDVQPEQAGTRVADRNVTIKVEEGKDLTLAGSVGVTSGISTGDNRVRPLGSMSIAHRDLFGTGRYLGLEVILAPPARREAFLTYREPFISRFNIPLQFTLFQSDDIRRGATLRQRGMFVEVSRLARYQTRWSLRYEYRTSECLRGDVCTLAESALLPGFDRSITNIKISSLTPTFFWDKRDDSIDPHRGFFTSASLEYAFRALAADAHFLKEFSQASWYLPVSTNSVFAVSARAGLIQDLHGGLVEDPITHELKRATGVPLSERFTAGGESSHRAYPLDLLGTACPTSTDVDCHATIIDIMENGKHTEAPIGGKGVFIFNAEYRFPIAGAFGGTAFVDAGNTFDASKITFGDLRYGIGTGLRYLSPVGPLRFDFGYKLKRQILRYDDSGNPVYERPFAYFITLGYAF